MKKLFYYFLSISSDYYQLLFQKNQDLWPGKYPQKWGCFVFPNHQGAFMDPLLMGCNIDRPVTSLTRSDIFGGPMQWFMDALQMLPVYRIRNGYTNLKKNEAIFNRCKKLLSNNQSIMMFSEAGHTMSFS